MRPVPAEPVPFSTPRAWTLLSRALDLARERGILTNETRRALAFGRLSPEDAAVFCALAEEAIEADAAARRLHRATPSILPKGEAARWFILNCIRQLVQRRQAPTAFSRATINRFLRSLSHEHQLTLLADLVEQWGALGGDRAMFDLLSKVTAA